MKPRNRSLSGALIAVLALPVFLGLLACIPTFPVPIGDPEKSRIDPEISGMWVGGVDGELTVWSFIPYDKRTWLMSWQIIEPLDDSCEPEESDPEKDYMSYQEIRDFLDYVGTACLNTQSFMNWKAWLTELGGRRYVTLQNKSLAMFEELDEEEWWWVFGIELSKPDLLRVSEIDSEHEVFSDIEEEKATRRKYERVFRKQSKNPEFYGSDPIGMHRVQEDDLEMFAELLLDDVAF
jgi:hypothetical protein